MLIAQVDVSGLSAVHRVPDVGGLDGDLAEPITLLLDHPPDHEQLLVVLIPEDAAIRLTRSEVVNDPGLPRRSEMV